LYHPRALDVIQTALPGVIMIQPRVFADDRGFFLETFHEVKFRNAGLPDQFVQDNHSRSKMSVLRGLHYQEPNAQGKLVRCSRGAIWDVAVDIRVGSPTFGKWVGVELNDENRRMLWVPEGFAHGFCAMTDESDVLYKCTTPYDQGSERSIAWNDPDIAIHWPVAEPILSSKDAEAPLLRDARTLPQFRP
jgi:dTDP-4-dehydrorhamnose 3,5-epimerase